MTGEGPPQRSCLWPRGYMICSPSKLPQSSAPSCSGHSEATVFFSVFLLLPGCGLPESQAIFFMHPRQSTLNYQLRSCGQQLLHPRPTHQTRKNASGPDSTTSRTSAAPGGAVDAGSTLPGRLGPKVPAPPARWAPRWPSCWRLLTSRPASTNGSGGRTPKGPPTSTTLSVGARPGEPRL